MDTALDLTLVVACYNEASHLEASVEDVLLTLDHTIWSCEIIFIDDCSQDDTRLVIERIRQKHPGHRLLTAHHDQNTGRGKTVSDGLRLARGRIAGFIDIDLEVHARYIPSMVAAIEQGADVALAQRIVQSVLSQLVRYVVSRGYHWLTRLLLGVTLADTEAGFKFFNRERLLPVLDETHDTGWFWDTEVILRAANRGYTIREIPCLFIRRTDKKSTVRLFRDSFRYFVALWRFRCASRRELAAHSHSSSARSGGKSPFIYSHPWLYRIIMQALYGRHFRDRYAAVAAEVPARSSVVEVCAGNCLLYNRFLYNKDIEYRALDISKPFVLHARAHGISASEFDLWNDEVPPADIVLMQASLYQFIPREAEILERLRRAARCKLIIAEPVQNLSASSVGWLALISRYLTKVSTHAARATAVRFDAKSLGTLFSATPGFERSFYIPGGREMVGIFRGIAP